MPEMKAIRVDNAETSTTSAPSAATDGIALPNGTSRRYSRVATEVVTNGGTTPTLTTAFGFGLEDQGDLHLLCIKGAASGTRTMRVRVYAYVSRYFASDAAVASSGKWYEIFDTLQHSSAANFNKAFIIQGL